jgi:hypothetical protein
MHEALRVARIPEAVFEKLVESDRPLTAAALARLGTRTGCGRPRLLRERTTIKVAFEAVELRAIQAAARKASMSVSAWLRAIACAALRDEES